MPYITTSELAELGYKWDDTLKPDIDEICVTASLMVDSYIQRVLPGKFSLEANDVEESVMVRVKNGVFKFFPKYYKVNSVESIVILLDAFTNYEVYADNFQILKPKSDVVLGRAIISNGEFQATAKYNAGFVPDKITKEILDPDSGGTITEITYVSTIPSGVKKATLLIVQTLLTEYFMVKNFNISMLTHFKQGNLQFQRSSKLLNQPIPPSAQLLLAEYRRTR